MIIKIKIRKPGSFEMTKFLNQKLIIQYYPSKKYFGEAKISVEMNIYFGTNRISNIIRLMKIERIEYRILFTYQENIRILFEYLEIFEYSNIFE